MTKLTDKEATAAQLYAELGISAPAARPSLSRLLADYWSASAALADRMAETDGAPAGSPEHENAQRKQFEAGNAMDAAACAICAFVPAFQFEARAKADFVAHLARENMGMLDSSWTAALLSSLPTLCAPDKEVQQ